MQNTRIYPEVQLATKACKVLVVEVTTKVRVSFTFLPLSSNHKGKLEFITRKSRVIQTSQGSSIDRELLGNA
jgi:hypothetical protein